VVYLLTTYVYIGVPLLFCLSALYGILRSVFSGVDDTAGPTGKDALARFQLGKIIFASWEYSITFPTSIAMNQVRDDLCTRRGFLNHEDALWCLRRKDLFAVDVSDDSSRSVFSVWVCPPLALALGH
jgi:hypothetical protein